MLTGKELNTIQGLLHYLSGSMEPPESPLAVEVKIIDSNGEEVGVIDYADAVEQYCFYPKGDS